MTAGEVIIDVNDVYKNFRVYFDKGSMLKEQFVNPGRSRYEDRVILKGVSFKVHKGFKSRRISSIFGKKEGLRESGSLC